MENDPPDHANGPPVAQAQVPHGVPEVPVAILPSAAATAPINSMKDVSHVTKFNGENFSDYRYEFLILMEQLGLSGLIDPSGGQVEAFPAELKFSQLCICHLFMTLSVVTHLLSRVTSVYTD